jgi:hypothetical protein
MGYQLCPPNLFAFWNRTFLNRQRQKAKTQSSLGYYHALHKSSSCCSVVKQAKAKLHNAVNTVMETGESGERNDNETV